MSTRRPGAAAAVIAAGLAAVVLPFLPVLRNGFTTWDDPLYVTANPAVRGGFGLAGMRWAWTSFHAANWHPLTWMSHQLDWTLFGDDPSGHHAASLLLHALGALLVFRVLARATGESWTGAAAAVLWAVHPLRVRRQVRGGSVGGTTSGIAGGRRFRAADLSAL